ncbi:hypothetical protein [Hymenobacter terrenus]|uniref:hypothetical protein n=1 Tax=Hymenobacter terrenus TaxID=1629124 RepID=UPI000619C91E|nr:hypothetical protein [Hymenobacter terrenus]
MLTPLPGSDGTPQTPAPTSNTGYIPRAELKVAALAELAADHWLQRPELPLVYTTSAAFKQLAADYSASLGTTDDITDSLSPDTERLGVLDDEINEHIPVVRSMLAVKYARQNKGRAFYPEFGLENKNGAFVLPRNRTERTKSLKKLAAALPAHGFDANAEFGVAYWQPLATEYATLVKKTDQVRGVRSDDVANKNTLRDEVEQVLYSLLHLIAANYPDETRASAERRKFGFLKERQ